jgi:hypothetical protein
MLSAGAYRTKNENLVVFLDIIFGKNHCKQMYDWEFSRKGQHPHYNTSELEK